MRLALCLLGISLSSGCLPYLFPPAQLSVGAGPSSKYIGDRNVREPGSAANYNLRAGLHPLGVVKSLRSRQIDVGVGYEFEKAGASKAGSHGLHGPYLELDAFPLPAAPTGASWRAGARVTGDLLFAHVDGKDYTGGGAMLAGLLEYVYYGAGGYSTDGGNGSFSGFSAGEVSIGGFLGVNRVMIADQAYWGGVIGLSVRLPFIVGVVCCYIPSGSVSPPGSSAPGSSSGPGSKSGKSFPGSKRAPASPSPSPQPARPSR